ncbi:MAG: ferrous iron transport protein A [Clostridia bacterium]|nr:ferrous iron transport protein A [Clostridia bacterium]
MTLNHLKPGQTATIKKVPLPRLTELGLIPGTKIRLVTKGPFGDPLRISFYGCELLLDQKTAEKTEVE